MEKYSLQMSKVLVTSIVFFALEQQCKDFCKTNYLGSTSKWNETKLINASNIEVFTAKLK